MNIKRLLRPSGKNLRFTYFLKNTYQALEPAFLKRRTLRTLEKERTLLDDNYLQDRVDYYCRLNTPTPLTNQTRVGDLSLKESNYSRDLLEYARFFQPELFIDLCFGDVTTVPATPSIVKSRPIDGDNANSVVLNLDKIRHFTFVDDDIPFEAKLDQAIARGSMYQPHRVRFMEQYFGSPYVDCGDVGKNPQCPEWKAKKISIYAHLKHKFVMCLEGNDVASNLKWVMGSNSIAVMPRPRYETWFMEGRLIPNVHYIEIKDDYSDLPEKLEYYAKNLEASQAIIENAHAHVNQFFNPTVEALVSLDVLKKYFSLTQTVSDDNLWI